jgi:exonuclease SbcD
MRILHTSDWHIGKRLGRYERMEEYRDVLAEVEHVAAEEDVDLVLVSGDLFDRPVPPVDALRLGLQALVRLGRDRPVVAVAGNHDSVELFEALAPLLLPANVHLVGDIKRPDEGGVLGPEVLGVDAAVACFPFLREAKVVDFMTDTGRWYGQYADRVASLCRAYSDAVIARAGSTAVPLLVAHFLVNGVKIGGGGAPRGERALHMGQAYAATEQAIPAGPQYAAMGHIHAPQKVPGSPIPAEYAGSLLALDFGEAGERKSVVVVDAHPGRLATRRAVPLESGRPLVRATGTWDELEGRNDLDGAFLDLVVTTTGPDPGLADLARERFAFLVKVRAEYPRAEEAAHASRSGRGFADLYEDYYRAAQGSSAPADLLSEFRAILEEVGAASA